jgi:hypothetical protein
MTSISQYHIKIVKEEWVMALWVGVFAFSGIPQYGYSTSQIAFKIISQLNLKDCPDGWSSRNRCDLQGRSHVM